MLNQNVYSPANPTEQKLSLALCISEEMLKSKGAYRVHGGGFAGTIQAFVPNELLMSIKQLWKVFRDWKLPCSYYSPCRRNKSNVIFIQEKKQ